jgi:hypothetical protein
MNMCLPLGDRALPPVLVTVDLRTLPTGILRGRSLQGLFRADREYRHQAHLLSGLQVYQIRRRLSTTNSGKVVKRPACSSRSVIGPLHTKGEKTAGAGASLLWHLFCTGGKDPGLRCAEFLVSAQTVRPASQPANFPTGQIKETTPRLSSRRLVGNLDGPSGT